MKIFLGLLLLEASARSLTGRRRASRETRSLSKKGNRHRHTSRQHFPGISINRLIFLSMPNPLFMQNV